MKILNCLSCGKILHGRSDKKYCDTYCKSAYHNQFKSKHELVIAKTNAILRKNRSILAHFSPAGKAIVRRDIIEQMGYDFSNFTAVFSFKTGVYYFCYDYGFLPTVDTKGIRKMVIVQKQEYMKTQHFNPWSFSQ